MEARDGPARSAEARTEMRKLANAEPASSFFKSVRAAEENSDGTGDTSSARSAAGNDPFAGRIADRIGEGNDSELIIVHGTGVITGAITNLDGVTNDPIHARDGHGDGIGDGKIDDAVGDGAQHRASRRAEVEDEAASATGETRSVEGVA